MVKVRIAPSPTGVPHIGTAYIGLINMVFSNSNDGKMILRIEDTDRTRSEKRYEDDIINALKWIGLKWDEGPDCGGSDGPYRQSERAQVYIKFAKELLEKKRAYHCFCTSEELDARRKAQVEKSGAFKYDKKCFVLPQEKIEQQLARGMPYVIRLNIPEEGKTRFDDLVRGKIEIENSTIDDQILLKSDGLPTYHLANVVDDHLMGVTHVIRAEEWIPSTPKHVLLYEAFDWTPPRFAHMPLLRNKDKSKISKRKHPVSIFWYKEEGYLPEALLNFLCLMGMRIKENEEIYSVEEMVQGFDWRKIATTGPVFDLEKCAWINGLYIRKLPIPELLRRSLPYLKEEYREETAYLERILPLVRERMKKLSEINHLVSYFFEEPGCDPELLGKKISPGEVVGVLKHLYEVYQALSSWQASALEHPALSFAQKKGWKPGEVCMPLRVAVTGRKETPPLFETMAVLGRERSLRRLEEATRRWAGVSPGEGGI